MPLIEVKMVEGVFSREQKEQIIHDLTEAMVNIEGESLRPYTVVLLHEVKSADWGVGGKALTTERIKELAAAAPS